MTKASREADGSRAPVETLAAHEGAPAVDRGVLGRLRVSQGPDQPDIVAELIDLFLVYAPSQLGALHAAAERQDGEGLRRLAHSLKGSCGNLGARRMAEVCEQIERDGERGAVRDALGNLPRLEAEFERVRRQLEAERAMTA